MKIFIVTHGFYPDNTPRSYRATELAKEFARQGHSVTVMLPNVSEERIEYSKAHNFSLIDLGNTKWKLPNFGKSGFGYLLTRAIARFLQLAFEYPDLELMFKVKRALMRVKEFDLLISVAVPYPIHWGVAWARTKKSPLAKVWIADCGDPYMGCDIDSFRKWPHFEFVEKWFMRKADYITIPVKSAIHAYYPEFHPKIRIIPQGFQLAGIRKQEYKKNPVPTFAYAGGFIPGKRDPRAFLDFLCSLQEDFKFYVFTKQIGLIQDYLNKLNNKLIVSSYIPREDLLYFMSGMDFLINFDNNTPNALPSKLIDYLIAGRPVLNITKDLDSDTIIQFFNGDYRNAYSLGSFDDYRIENVCNRFLDLANG